MYTKTQHKKDLIHDSYRELKRLLEDLLPENQHKVEAMASLNKTLEESFSSFSYDDHVNVLYTESVVRSNIKTFSMGALEAK